MLLQIKGIISTIGWLDIIDILLVAVLLYKLYIMIRDTRAVALLKGLIVLLIATLVSKWLSLNVINWLLQKTMTVVLVALPIVFQPELRRGLEQLGRGKLFSKRIFLDEEETKFLMEEIVRGVSLLAKTRTGAIIVFERETGLNDYAETGTRIDGLVSSELLTNIFVPNSPLHDGAVIIRANRVMSAGCILPLSDARTLGKELGTRHRASLGLSEQTDSIVVVVSEETGIISVAQSGNMVRYIEPDGLKGYLQPLYFTKTSSFGDFFNRRLS
jgi:diadenylate cyclase